MRIAITLSLVLCALGAGSYYYLVHGAKTADFGTTVEMYNLQQREEIADFYAQSKVFFGQVSFNDKDKYPKAFLEKILDVAKVQREKSVLSRREYGEIVFLGTRTCIDTVTKEYESCVKKGLVEQRRHGSFLNVIEIMETRLLDILEKRKHPFLIEMMGWRSCLAAGSSKCIQAYVNRYKDTKDDSYVDLVLALSYLVLENGPTGAFNLFSGRSQMGHENYNAIATVYRYLYQSENCVKYSQAAVDKAESANLKSTAKFHYYYNHAICLRRLGKYEDARQALETAKTLVDLTLPKNVELALRVFIENMLLGVAESKPIVKVVGLVENSTYLNSQYHYLFTLVKDLVENPDRHEVFVKRLNEIPVNQRENSLLRMFSLNLAKDLKAVSKD